MSDTDKNVCPDCWSENTNHEPFPKWAYVAPCIAHIVCSGFCFFCGGPLDRNLECKQCAGERLLEQADLLRKEEQEKDRV